MSNQTPRDPHARAEINLTLEEIEVLKECRVNSIYYRGLPLGILSALAARGAIQTGYFPFLARWSKAVYAGVFGLGFFSGIISYKDICFQKIMSLENSSLKEQFLEYQKQSRSGRVGQSEFSNDDLDNSSRVNARDEASSFRQQTMQLNHQQHQHDDEEQLSSPLMKRMQERSKWEDIRQQSRQTPNERGGISYEELKKRNRDRNPGNVPEDHDKQRTSQKESMTDFESFSQPTYTEEKSSRALNFSSDDSRPLSLFSDDLKKEKDEELPQGRRRRVHQATSRKNQYGDEME